MQLPPPLGPGAILRVVAPSGPFDSDQLRSGLSRFSDFEVRVPDGLYGRRQGFFAGSDTIRGRELQEALDCPDTQGVIVARGGYGLARLLPGLSLDALEKHPKWIIGFSDATVLHTAVHGHNLASLHAANGTTLSRLSASDFRETLALLGGDSSQSFNDLQCWSPGLAAGPLFGGNLTVLFAEAAAGRLTIPKGAVLFLEDVTETSYRIDRMLTSLNHAGHLTEVAAVVLGEFVDCSPGKFDVPAEDVLREQLVSLGVPVIAGLPVGHGARNRPLLLGAKAAVDANRGQMKIGPPS